jgi:TPR repeat protein
MGDSPAAAARKPCCVCDAPNGKDCTACKSRRYCSKKCQLVDWKEGGHKAQCKQLAKEFQDRLLDELMPAQLKIKEEPAIVADVAPAAGLKAAARLSAVSTAKACEAGAKAVEASAAKGVVPDWRGTCAICLDALPVQSEGKLSYSCCGAMICTKCSSKCDEYDTRCPLCRAPALKSHDEWLSRLQVRANVGNADAEVNLGDAYSNGLMGLVKDFERASEFYRLAATRGHAVGQAQLGRCYEFGRGVEIDEKTAAQWYRRAAEQGYPGAQCHLGMMLLQGRGVSQSYDEGAKWLHLAAAQGDKDALTLVSML